MRSYLVTVALSLAIPLAVPATLSAQNKQMELEWLRRAGATFGGQAVSDASGTSAASAGDVNGDGFADLVVGAPNFDNGSKLDAGRAYLVYGGAGITGTHNLSAADAIFTGPGNLSTPYHAGQAVAGVGDVNGDFIDDFLIGEPDAKTNGNAGSGRVYLVFGSMTTPLAGPYDLNTFTGGVVITGANDSDLAGWALAGPGDVNGDGENDLLIGAPGAENGATGFAGATYVVYGGPLLLPPAGGTIDLGALTSTTGLVIRGASASERTGDAVGAAGDVNGDGLADLLIGAQFSDPSGKTDAGRAWIVYGSASPPPSGTIALATLGTAGVSIAGTTAGDHLGYKVAGKGDVNGDGLCDVAVSAPQSDLTAGTNVDAGRILLIYGKVGGLPATVNPGDIGDVPPHSVAGVVLTGVKGSSGNPGGDKAGVALALAGDFNKDGYSDLVIGSGDADANGDDHAGEVYIVEGGPSLPGDLPLSTLGARGTVLAGIDAFDTAGGVLSYAGDMNADGFDDLIIGAVGGDPAGGSGAGETYAVYGACHMIEAIGPVAEGGFLNLRSHGTPGVANLTFGTVFALPAPLNTGFGPWWLVSQLDLFPLAFDAKGELAFSLPMPAPGAIPGLLGLTIYMQTLGAPQGNHHDLTYLLAFTVE